MAVRHAPMAGEAIVLDPENQNSAAHAFNRPPGSGRAPTQAIGRRRGEGPPGQTPQRPPQGQLQGRTDERGPQQSTPQAPHAQQKLALAIWHGPGWYQETIDMLDGFFEFDGQQDRACYILSNPVHPLPIEVMQAAQRAFTFVRVYDTMFANPEDGIITPYALYDFAGIVPQKLGQRGRIFYTLPLRVIGPNSLPRLEQQAFQVNSGRDKATGKLLGSAILGAVRDTKQGKFPFSSFVALPTWVIESQFPLVRGLSKMPAKTAQDSPMSFLRYELMKNMAVTELINPEPWKDPSDPRFVLLEGVELKAPRFTNIPLQSRASAPAPQEEEFEDPVFGGSLSTNVAPAAPVIVGSGLVARAAIPEFMPREEGVTVVARFPELPEHAEIEERISREGLGWLKSYEFPSDLKTIKVIHNAELGRRKALQAEEDLADTPEPAPAPPAPPVRRATIEAPVALLKGTLKVPAKKTTAKKPKAALTVPAE